MRIRLVESIQPINKLDYNIQTVVLPTFNKYGFKFKYPPLKVNDYKYTFSYNDTSVQLAITLTLMTSHVMIEKYLSTDEDANVDLYADMLINGKKVDIGLISSKDSDSVNWAIEDSNLKEVLTSFVKPSKAQVNREKLIAPAIPTPDYKPMSKISWINEKQRIADAVDTAKRKLDEEMTHEEQVAAVQAYYKGEPYPEVMQNFRDISKRYNDFISKIYPYEELGR